MTVAVCRHNLFINLTQQSKDVARLQTKYTELCRKNVVAPHLHPGKADGDKQQTCPVEVIVQHQMSFPHIMDFHRAAQIVQMSQVLSPSKQIPTSVEHVVHIRRSIAAMRANVSVNRPPALPIVRKILLVTIPMNG